MHYLERVYRKPVGCLLPMELGVNFVSSTICMILDNLVRVSVCSKTFYPRMLLLDVGPSGACEGKSDKCGCGAGKGEGRAAATALKSGQTPLLCEAAEEELWDQRCGHHRRRLQGPPETFATEVNNFQSTN